MWCKPAVLYHQRGCIKWCEVTSSGASCRRAVMLSSTRDTDIGTSSGVCIGGGSGVRRRPLVAGSQVIKVIGARKVGERETPTIMMNTRCKGSVGAKACESVVQSTPNMCGLGGSAERPTVQNNPFLLLRTLRVFR